MNRLHSKQQVSMWLFLPLLCLLVLDAPLLAHPNEGFDHRGLNNMGKPDHEGGELGGLAALLFGIANLPVVLSIVAKALAKLLPDRMSIKRKIMQGNAFQKKYLMKLHYWVNPFAFGVAIVHFFSSECRSTAMPELGMGAMLFVSVLGLMMTLRLSPRFMRKIVFRLHTSPITTILVFSFLVMGHSVIE
jgi:hypothetical protein